MRTKQALDVAWASGRSRTRSRGKLALLLVLLALAAAVGCKPKPQVGKKIPAPPPPKPGAAAPTVTLTATPPTIQRGQSTTLSWKSENAYQLTLEPALGQVPAQGTMTVSPFNSTTYRIIAQGAGGKTEATARVTVSERPVPPEPPAPKEENIEETFKRRVGDIYFDYNRFDIRADAIPVLQGNADWLRANPNARIAIEGHCDERGSEEYNLGLGESRANAARDYLVQLGISGDRVRTISYGKERPQCSEQTEDCWQRNRRAHFVLAK